MEKTKERELALQAVPVMKILAGLPMVGGKIELTDAVTGKVYDICVPFLASFKDDGRNAVVMLESEKNFPATIKDGYLIPAGQLNLTLANMSSRGWRWRRPGCKDEYEIRGEVLPDKSKG